jgi:hypothetical protein
MLLWRRLILLQDRQALCESLPYYPSDRCIAYEADQTIRGILLERDELGKTYMDDEVVICRVYVYIEVDSRT